ncbi:hypothetical protein GCM10023185_44070 [Hymenobacter saemangeumensis]|uniref:EF-hand domain-containing protein n=2 Tax=Hymenobacter saemangeumensis TaxID=1084522 RepID=A0ABP8ISL4_9BACT
MPAAERAAKEREAVARIARTSHVAYGAPVDADSAGTYFYQPATMQSAEGESGFESGYSKDYHNPPCFNLVFFHKQTGQAHLLLPHGRYLLAGVNSHEGRALPQRYPYLFYDIVKADTNHDGRLNHNDLHSLFVSDKAGRQLRQLTPDSLGLRGWRFFPNGSPGLLVELARPVKAGDHAGELNQDSPNTWLRFDLANLQAPPHPLLPPALNQVLTQQLIQAELKLPKQ